MSNQRTTTRSQSEVNPNLLAAPLTLFRRRRSPTRDQRLASPNHIEEEEPIFTFNMATPEQIAAIREELRNEIRAEFRNETAAAAAQIPDAIRRKPEIPNFDKDHIDIWIKRTENAYIRANITSTQEKFAFLESKFPVNFNPRVDEFLYGDATPANWTSFLNYLRAEYGPTKQQRASIFIDGFKRNGRRPSQYAAALDDTTKDVTVDEIKKEMLLREMPMEIRRMLQERIETLSFKDAAKIADSYFDAEGRPRHSTTPSVNQVTTAHPCHSTPPPVNEVTTANRWEAFTTTAFSEPFCDNDQAINAIGRKFSRRPPDAQPRKAQGGGRPQQHVKTGQTLKTEASKAPIAVKANPNYPVKKSVDLCQAHFKFGDKARYCEVSCSRFDEQRFPGNGQAGQK